MIERAVPELLTSPDWQPHCPTLQAAAGLRQPLPGPRRKRCGCWSIAASTTSPGPQTPSARTPRTRYYDLWHGVELKPTATGSTATLTFEIEAQRFRRRAGRRRGNAGRRRRDAAAAHARRAGTRLATFGPVEIPAAEDRRDPADRAGQSSARGHGAGPGGKFRFQVSGVEIEGGDVRASTSNTLGKTCPAPPRQGDGHRRPSTSTNIRSPTPSSRGSWTPRATSPRTSTTSSRIGRTGTTRRAGTASR